MTGNKVPDVHEWLAELEKTVKMHEDGIRDTQALIAMIRATLQEIEKK